ncbi:D-2-hydroxyacid dehydrogenase [Halomicrobium urmianum]|uniref:D-2-hydroxyacid dehydrogenase n=1 Tax=Halomicrobium urmianum TaxID=1586233 RepID=UPI001CDA2641|nr:D-2-hydroxyacid dehydrogenase [Halomicrobium urmianum]
MPGTHDGESTDVLVLRQKVHGIDVGEYAAALRERLPDESITVARTPAEERAAIRDAPVATGVVFDEQLLEYADDLELFAGVYAGYDHLPLSAFAERDVAVTTASGVHGPNVAEHVVGAFLAFARRFFEARRRQEKREWRHLRSHELAGSTVAVVGLGAIGRSIVERLDGFDVDTVGVRYTPEKGGPTDEVHGFDDIHEAVRDAEYVALACPLTDETEGLVDAPVLRTMRPDAVLVNVARGPVVDTDALVDAVRSNHIRGAQLDVTDPEPLPEDHPLWNLENVFVTPHCSGHTPEYYQRTADIVAENVRQARETGEWNDLRNQIDLS